MEPDLKNGGLAQRLMPASCLYGLQVGPACNEATATGMGAIGPAIYHATGVVRYGSYFDVNYRGTRF